VIVGGGILYQSNNLVRATSKTCNQAYDSEKNVTWLCSMITFFAKIAK